jgi:hypothetical protein
LRPAHARQQSASRASPSLIFSFFCGVSTLKVNDAPDRVWLAKSFVNENTLDGIMVSGLFAYDRDFEDLISFALLDDGDGAFQLVGSEIIVKDVRKLNFEAAKTINIKVSATDNGDPPLTANFQIPVTINDVNEQPSLLKLTRNTFYETARLNSIIARVDVIDPDNEATAVQSHECEISDNAGPFSISDNVIRLAIESVDYERRKLYEVELTCTDNGTPAMALVQMVLLHVLNRNEAPLTIQLSGAEVRENTPTGTIVGILTTTDPDNIGEEDAQGTFMYDVISIDDYNECESVPNNRCKFFIDGSVLKLASPLDYESKQSYGLIIQVTDAGGASLQANFTISVLDTNDVPDKIFLTNTTVTEGIAGALVGKLMTEDQDYNQSHDYTIVDVYMSDGALFTIENDILSLAPDVTVEFEQTPQLLVVVVSRDDGAPGRWLKTTLEIDVKDMNEPPNDIEIIGPKIGHSNGNVVVNEMAIKEGECIGGVVVTDPDNFGVGVTDGSRAAQLHVCRIVEDSSADTDSGIPRFEFQTTADGKQELCLIDGELDFEANPNGIVEIYTDCTDNGVPAFLTTFEVVLQILNVNEPPNGITIGGVNVNNFGQISLQVNENIGVGTSVGHVTVNDPDNCPRSQCYPWQTHSVEVTNSTIFAVRHNELVLLSPLNAQINPAFELMISVTDNGQLPLTTSFVALIKVIEVTSEEKIQPSITLSGTHSIQSGNTVGDVIGELSVIGNGKFEGAIHKFELLTTMALPSAQLISSSPFMVAGATLVVRDNALFHPGASFAVQLVVVQNGKSIIDTTIVLTTSAQNVAPTIDGLPQIFDLPEDTEDGSVLALIKVMDMNNPMGCVLCENEDGDNCDSNSLQRKRCWNSIYCAVEITACFPRNHPSCDPEESKTVVGTAGPFNLDHTSITGNVASSTYHLRLHSFNLDFEDISAYELKVTCSDDGIPPLGSSRSIRISVIDVNEPPDTLVFVDFQGKVNELVVPEGAKDGYLVGSFVCTDPDVGQSLQYSIRDVNNVTLPFRLSGRELLVDFGGGVEIDYESTAEYRILFTATDDATPALSTEWTVVVFVIGINERPTQIRLSCGCAASTCMHMGNCMPIGIYGYLCRCKTGFSGRNCQLDTLTSTAVAEQTVIGKECLQLQPDVLVNTTLARIDVFDFDFDEVHQLSLLGSGAAYLGIRKDNTLYVKETLPKSGEITVVAIDSGGLQIVEDFSFEISICGNGGRCSPDADCQVDQEMAVCVCRSGFSGDGIVCAEALCNGVVCTAREPCASNPCERGACLVDSSETKGFRCHCPVGTFGERCENVLDPCQMWTCEKNSTMCLTRTYSLFDLKANEKEGQEEMAGCGDLSNILVVLQTDYQDEHRLCSMKEGKITEANASSNYLTMCPSMGTDLVAKSLEVDSLHAVVPCLEFLLAPSFNTNEAFSRATEVATNVLLIDNVTNEPWDVDAARSNITQQCSKSTAKEPQSSIADDQIATTCCKLLHSVLIDVGPSSTVSTDFTISRLPPQILPTPLQDLNSQVGSVASSEGEESSSLKTAIGVASGVTVAILVVAAIFYLLRSKVRTTKVIGPSASVHKPSQKRGKQAPAPQRKAVSFVNPAYANVAGTDGIETHDAGFLPKLSAGDEEQGYLKVTEEADDHKDPNRGYLEVGDESGTPDAPVDTFSIQIANPLFVSTSPPSSPNAPKAASFDRLASVKSTAKKASAAKPASTLSIKQAASMHSTKVKAPAMTAPSFPVMRSSPTADDGDRCTFLATCVCSDCVGE